MDNNAMNIELLKAMRGVWIIEIESLEHKLKNIPSYTTIAELKARLETFEKCLKDLIDIIGE